MNNITFVNNVFDKQKEDFKTFGFGDLLSIFSENNDIHFKHNLRELGYYKKLFQLEKKAKLDIENKNWQWLARRPDGLAFFLKGYHRDFILTPLREDVNYLTQHDFFTIKDLPAGFIESLEITRYEVLKSLYPVFSFASFQPNMGKKEAGVTNLAPYMALDIDLKYDDENEMLYKLSKYMDIHCILTSPSGGLRPVIKIDLSTEKLLDLIKWQGKRVDDDLKWTPKLYKLYLHVVFDKLERQLIKETILVNGQPVQFALDNKCKNLNRFWYISRNAGRNMKLNESAKSIQLTRKDCFNYSKKVFPPYNDILAGI